MLVLRLRAAVGVHGTTTITLDHTTAACPYAGERQREREGEREGGRERVCVCLSVLERGWYGMRCDAMLTRVVEASFAAALGPRKRRSKVFAHGLHDSLREWEICTSQNTSCPFPCGRRPPQ